MAFLSDRHKKLGISLLEASFRYHLQNWGHTYVTGTAFVYIFSTLWSNNSAVVVRQGALPMPQPKKETRRPTHETDMPSQTANNVTKLDASSDIIHVRKVVAGNPNTPLSVLSRLAEDECEAIRRSVAENAKTPVEVLKRLSLDPGTDVRLAVAENINTPAEILAALAQDHAVDVRFGVAENPHMPENILLKLARDENPYIRCRALKTLQMLSPEVQSRLNFLMQGPLEP